MAWVTLSLFYPWRFKAIGLSYLCVCVLSLYSYLGVLGLLRNAGLKGHGPYIQNALHHDTHSFSCGEFQIVAPWRDKMYSIPLISTSQQHSFNSVLSFAAFICFSSKLIIFYYYYSACNVWQLCIDISQTFWLSLFLCNLFIQK